MTAATVSDLNERRAKILGAVQLVRKYSAASGSARGVLNVLATYADADGRNVWIGRTRLEQEAGLSRSTLRRAIRKLEELGEVETLEEGHGARSSRYRITLSPPVENLGETRPYPNGERVQSEPGEGSPRTRGRVHSEPQPVETGIYRGEATVTFPDHCPAHRTVEDPPPCRKCQRTREANAAIELEARKARDAENRRRRLEEQRAQDAALRDAAATDDSPGRQAFRNARRRNP